MAKANISLKDGTKIVVDGTADEISKILKLYKDTSIAGDSVDNKKTRTKRKKKPANKSTGGKTAAKKGPQAYIAELKDEGFFNKKRSINEIQSKLEEYGHIYPLTHLSTPLRRLVQQRELGRMKESNNWVYVKR